jgi:hypothetical protein
MIIIQALASEKVHTHARSRVESKGEYFMGARFIPRYYTVPQTKVHIEK